MYEATHTFTTQNEHPPSPGFGGGDEADSYSKNLASAVELLVFPTAAALEGLPELARNRVKLLFQSQRQLTAARATMTFLSDKVGEGQCQVG